MFIIKTSNLSVLFILFYAVIAHQSRNKRIIGGEEAPANEFPWAVTIRGTNPATPGSVSVCGATIIHSRWLLTAAHCFWTSDGEGKSSDMRDAANWHMIAGQVFVVIDSYRNEQSRKTPTSPSKPKPQTKPKSKNLLDLDLFNDLKSYQIDKYINSLMKEFGRRNIFRFNKRGDSKPPISSKEIMNHFHFERVFLHPKYRPDNIEFDIALMKLDRGLPLGTVPGIQVLAPPRSASQPLTGAECVVVGWGCMQGGGAPTTKARFARLQVLDFKACNRIYDNKAGLNQQHEFCAGYVNRGIGICPGDSGGGLVCKDGGKSQWYVGGVTSATHGEKPGMYPGLFTRVSYFGPWIVKVMERF